MLGYPDRESLLAINAVELYLNPEDRRRWQALLETEGVIHDFETQWTRHDGTIIWGRESTRVIRDDKGQTLYYDGAMEDIAERVQTEAEIRRRNRELAIKEKYIRKSLNYLIGESNRKLMNYDRKISEFLDPNDGQALNLKGNRAQEAARRDELVHRRDTRLAELEHEKQLSEQPPEVLGVSVI